MEKVKEIGSAVGWVKPLVAYADKLIQKVRNIENNSPLGYGVVEVTHPWAFETI